MNETTLDLFKSLFQGFFFSGLQIAILSHIIIQRERWPNFGPRHFFAFNCVVSIPVFTVFLVFSEKGRREVGSIRAFVRDFGGSSPRRCAVPSSAETRLSWKFWLWILETTQTDKDNVWTLQKCKYKEREKMFGLVTLFSFSVCVSFCLEKGKFHSNSASYLTFTTYVFARCWF